MQKADRFTTQIEDGPMTDRGIDDNPTIRAGTVGTALDHKTEVVRIGIAVETATMTGMTTARDQDITTGEDPWIDKDTTTTTTITTTTPGSAITMTGVLHSLTI